MKQQLDQNKFIEINRTRGAVAAIGFVLFIIIAYFIATRETLTFDTVVCSYIYDLRNNGLTAFFTAITYLGNWQTLTLICCLFLIFPQNRRSFGIPLSVSAILAVSIQKLLKISFHRARPDLTLHLIQQGGYSFPSGHSFTIIVFYGLLIYLCRQKIKSRTIANIATVLLSCLILAIGFSRVYLGVHYPSDILGGWTLGLTLLMIIISALPFFSRRKTQI